MGFELEVRREQLLLQAQSLNLRGRKEIRVVLACRVVVQEQIAFLHRRFAHERGALNQQVVDAVDGREHRAGSYRVGYGRSDLVPKLFHGIGRAPTKQLASGEKQRQEADGTDSDSGDTQSMGAGAR